VSPHGTPSRYTGGCRCDACRAAWAAYVRTYRREQRAKYRAEHPRKPHYRKVPESAHPVIVQRIHDGETLAMVAADYGISGARVQQIVAAADPSIAAGRARAIAEIRRLRAENQTLRALLGEAEAGASRSREEGAAS
jgi:hypothetical protein